MTIFKSRQVSLDPEPWQGGTGDDPSQRYDYEQGLELVANGHALTLDPRPEFEPTRDPEPLEGPFGNRRAADRPMVNFIWAPRREQFDTPVNPILSGLREDVAGSLDLDRSVKAHAEFWLSCESDWEGSQEQVKHARAVLNRLARWSA